MATAEPTGAVRHYVYDLLPIRPQVHQDQCLDLACKLCGRVTPAPLPPGLPKGRYDPSVQAMTALLRGELCQSVRQTRAVMTQVMGAKTQQKVGAALAPAVAQAMDYAQTHARPHADETSGPLDTKKGWLSAGW